MKDDSFFKLQGMRLAGASISRCAELLKVSESCVKKNLALGLPSDRKKAKRKPPKNVTDRRKIVRRLLLHKVVVKEDLEPTLNRNGARRKNSRKKRTSTRFPTGTLGRCRRELATNHGIRVSKATLHRDKTALGLICKKRPRGPERYEGDEAKRLEYAAKTIDLARKHASNTLFVDEKLFDTLDRDRTCYVKSRREPAPARETERFPTRVHAFAMVGVGYRFIHVFPAGRKVTHKEYQQCLKKNLKQMKTKYFVADNAGPHTAVKDWLEKQKTKGIISHPPRSPDMNPIERVWSNVGRKVSSAGPLSEQSLRRFVVKCFNEIPQEHIDKTCRAWPSQLEAVIANKGATVCKHLNNRSK